MRIGGPIAGIRLYPADQAHGNAGRSQVHRKDVQAAGTPERGPATSTEVEARTAALPTELETESRGEGANRAVRKQLKGIVHAVRDELKQIVRQSGSGEDAVGAIDVDQHHALKKLNHEFRHAIRSGYRDASANGTIDGEQLLTAVRSEFEGLLDRVAGALSPSVVDADETPEAADEAAGRPERLQALAGRIEALLGELGQLWPVPIAEEAGASPAPSGGAPGYGFTFERALSVYTDSGLSSEGRAPDSDVDSLV